MSIAILRSTPSLNPFQNPPADFAPLMILSYREDTSPVQRVEASLPGVRELRPKIIREARFFYGDLLPREVC
jgi:hypothetical protein